MIADESSDSTPFDDLEFLFSNMGKMSSLDVVFDWTLAEDWIIIQVQYLKFQHQNCILWIDWGGGSI
ncbi:MAG: hypothetical protein CM15mP32_0710 [Flavobacteriaceae bacterium]|nr:MAG: hypothetical protein CM15mP32_0710 [Flavobacteriaceae bacterium]